MFDGHLFKQHVKEVFLYLHLKKILYNTIASSAYTTHGKLKSIINKTESKTQNKIINTFNFVLQISPLKSMKYRAILVS